MTDAAGFLLFLRPVRDILLGLLARHVQTRMETRVVVDGEEVARNGPIIDGEYRDVTDPASSNDPKP